MGRLALGIIDNDKVYTKCLADYITSNYSASFSVSCFSAIEPFAKEVQESPDRFDVVLIAPDLCRGGEIKNCSGTIIFLDEEPSCARGEMPSIYKFKHSDSIVGDILDIYNGMNSTGKVLSGNKARTKVVGVYSPLGGAGKTTISIGLSIQCARVGMQVFYLNLENASSVCSYFKQGKGHTFSKVLFSLKCNNGQGMETVKGAGIVSEINGIHYYLPPESSFELEEMPLDGYLTLVDGLKDSGLYDVMVIDMDSCINKRNLSVLQKCDITIMPVLRGAVAAEKMRIMGRDIELFENMEDCDITTGIVTVENKFCPEEAETDMEEVLPGKKVFAQLPYCREIKTMEGCELFFNGKNSFVRGLDDILGNYILKNRDKQRKCTGGEYADGRYGD